MKKNQILLSFQANPNSLSLTHKKPKDYAFSVEMKNLLKEATRVFYLNYFIFHVINFKKAPFDEKNEAIKKQDMFLENER